MRYKENGGSVKGKEDEGKASEGERGREKGKGGERSGAPSGQHTYSTHPTLAPLPYWLPRLGSHQLLKPSAPWREKLTHVQV